MPERLAIPADRIGDVANAAHVCPRTVQKYRDGLHVLDVVEIAITNAARELPADAQLEIPSVAGQQPIHAGDVFGRLTAESLSNVSDNGKVWACLCVCGERCMVRVDHLKNGHTKSCGCLSRESIIARSTKHGCRKSAEYRPWASMLHRTRATKGSDHRNYSSRGIIVCERWLTFENFLADMGPRPSPQHSIDRIDNDGNYEPGNCRWATAVQQAANQRISQRNRSGVKGVCWIARKSKWQAYITRNGVHLVLGQFSNLEDAASARRCAERTNEVGAVTTRINRSGVSPNMGQPGEVRSCPDSSTDCTSAIRSKRAGRSASIPKRPRVTIIMPEEATP